MPAPLTLRTPVGIKFGFMLTETSSSTRSNLSHTEEDPKMKTFVALEKSCKSLLIALGAFQLSTKVRTYARSAATSQTQITDYAELVFAVNKVYIEKDIGSITSKFPRKARILAKKKFWLIAELCSTQAVDYYGDYGKHFYKIANQYFTKRELLGHDRRIVDAR